MCFYFSSSWWGITAGMEPLDAADVGLLVLLAGVVEVPGPLVTDICVPDFLCLLSNEKANSS